MKHSGKTEQKPKFRLPFSAVLLYLLLIAAAVSGVTFSKYITGTTVGDTARVAIMRDITVTETGNFAETDKWVITPGVDMIKKAVVNFEGSEMTCYVFCEIKTSGWSRLNDNYSFAFSGGGENILGWAVNNDWKFLSGNGSERALRSCIIIRRQSLPTAPLFFSVTTTAIITWLNLIWTAATAQSRYMPATERPLL